MKLIYVFILSFGVSSRTPGWVIAIIIFTYHNMCVNYLPNPITFQKKVNVQPRVGTQVNSALGHISFTILFQFNSAWPQIDIAQLFFPLASRNTKTLQTKMLSFYKQQTVFSQIFSKRAKIPILFFMKNSQFYIQLLYRPNLGT